LFLIESEKGGASGSYTLRSQIKLGGQGLDVPHRVLQS
jgi:hypothetical protein